MLRRLVILAGFLAISLLAFGQDDFYVDVTTSKADLAVGENFRVDYSLKFRGRNLNLQHSGIQVRKPNLSGFQLVDEYSGSSMDFGFGSSEITIQKYTLVLRAEKEGKQTIGPLKFIMNGKEYASGELSLVIKKGSGSAPQAQTQAPAPQNSGPDASKLFARMSVSKSNPYKGEAVIVTHRIYSAVDLVSLGDVKFPSFNGFWSKEVPSTEVKLSNQTINGVNYRVVELKQHVLFPQQSGKLEIAPLEAECIVQEIKERPARDRMEQMFYGNVIRYRDNAKHTIKSPSLSISVKDIPEQGKPASFTGLVGNFRMEAQVDRNNLSSNEAFNLKYTIRGQGNVDLIPEPSFSFPPDFDKYDPKVTSNAKATGSGVNGSKSYEYLLISRKAGEFTIAPVEFSYFDPAQGKHITLNSPEFSITVAKGKTPDRSVSVSGNSQEDVQFIGQDIRYIKTGNLGLTMVDTLFADSKYFWLLFLIPFAGLIALLMLVRKPKPNASRKALRLAMKSIMQARKHLRQDRFDLYSESLSQAMYSYASRKLGLPISGLTAESIEKALSGKISDNNLISAYKEIIEQSEFLRFAPSGATINAKELLDRAAQLIETLERSLK